MRRLALNAALSLSEARALFAQRALARLSAQRPNGLKSASYALRGESRRLILLLSRAYRVVRKVYKKRARRKMQLKRVTRLLRSIVPHKLHTRKLRSMCPTLRANYVAARAVSKVI